MPRRAFIVALVVGPLLTLINQGDRIAAGEIDWFKAGLTFLVPYVVATVGAVGARQRPKESAATAVSAPCQPEAARLSSARLGAAESAADSGVKRVKARVHVTLKNGVLDPQGKAIEHALAALGFDGVGDVRQGKVIEFSLVDSDPQEARARVEAMCEKLLANTVIENYAIDLDG